MPTLAPMPVLAPWLPAGTDPKVVDLVRRTIASVGVCEAPLGSNRGLEVDEWNRRAGAAPASFWCASFAAAMWRDAGLPTAGRGRDPSCDQLMAWAKATGRWSARPALGAITFYGPVPHDAQHVAIVVRTSPALLVVGGNERLGAASSRNGVAVQLRAEQRTDILGYAWPFPVQPPTAGLP